MSKPLSSEHRPNAGAPSIYSASPPKSTPCRWEMPGNKYYEAASWATAALLTSGKDFWSEEAYRELFTVREALRSLAKVVDTALPVLIAVVGYDWIPPQ